MTTGPGWECHPDVPPGTTTTFDTKTSELLVDLSRALYPSACEKTSKIPAFPRATVVEVKPTAAVVLGPSTGGRGVCDGVVDSPQPSNKADAVSPVSVILMQRIIHLQRESYRCPSGGKESRARLFSDSVGVKRWRQRESRQSCCSGAVPNEGTYSTTREWPGQAHFQHLADTTGGERWHPYRVHERRPQHHDHG